MVIRNEFSTAEIADDVGCSRETVRRYRRVFAKDRVAVRRTINNYKPQQDTWGSSKQWGK